MSADAKDFAANAEQLRLNGDAHAAARVAEAGLARAPEDLHGRIALALARIDLGDVLQARDELAAVLAPLCAAPVPSARDDFGLQDGVGDDELETAFAEAESDPNEMMDANRVVEQTLRAADLDLPEPDASGPEFAEAEPDFDVSRHPTYATESMAMLLDEQGRHSEAAALRESLAARRREQAADPFTDPGPDPANAWGASGLGPDHARQLQVVATLEGWLYNLRRQAERSPRRGDRGAAGGAA